MKRKTGIVIMLAVGWLLVGHVAAFAAAPTQAREPAPASQAPSLEATGVLNPSFARQEQREAEAPAGLVKPGSKVRVYSLFSVADDDDEDMRLEGILLGADETSLRIRHQDRVITLPRNTIRSIDVDTKKRAGVSVRRLAIGAGIGAGAGFFGGWASTGCSVVNCPSKEAGQQVSSRIRVGTFVGAAIGAVVGHATRGSTWTEVPLERVRVSLSPTGWHGFRLALSVGF